MMMKIIIDNDYEDDDDAYNDSAGDDGWMLEPYRLKGSHNT